jgi:hypothetical protein
MASMKLNRVQLHALLHCVYLFINGTHTMRASRRWQWKVSVSLRAHKDKLSR